MITPFEARFAPLRRGPVTPHPGQTIGPFFGYALPYDAGSELVPPGSPGAIRLHGRVLDGAGQPVPDALLELWQVDADGVVSRETGSLRRDGFTFTGWGRAATDNDGRYVFSTVAPGASVPGAAPFFAVTVFARGLLNRLFTRAYLPDDETALNDDPLLSLARPGTPRRRWSRGPDEQRLRLRHPAAGSG